MRHLCQAGPRMTTTDDGADGSGPPADDGGRASDTPTDIATKIRTAITTAFPGPPTVTVGGTGRVVQLGGIDKLDASG